MPYTITNSDGTPLVTIGDGALDTVSTSLALPGPNFVGYGQYLNQNLVNLLESFASNSAPFSASQIGQLWFDKTHQVLNVFTNNGYSPVSGILINSVEPIGGVHVGTVWFNTTTGQIFIYTPSNQFELIGPLYTSAQGMSGAIPSTVGDIGIVGLQHNVVKLQFGNLTIGTFSSDSTFSPSPAISGFPKIYPGLTINETLISGMAQFFANANVAAYLPLDPTILAINSHVTSSNASVVAYVNDQDTVINAAIIANNTSTNANITTANNAVVAYVNSQISTVSASWTANAVSQENKIIAANASIASANAAIAGVSANVDVLQTKVYANANVASYLPIYTGNIASSLLTTTTAVVNGNVTAQNLSVSGQYNGSRQTVTNTTVSNVATTIYTTTAYCNFCLVNGSDGTGNIFADVVLMSPGNANVNVISSLNANGTPGVRSYTSLSGNLRLQMPTTANYSVKTVTVNL
ncbi:MAG TPA: hypothetical protein VFM18_19045 [Methanosarcina sp.]|nr:hypothetical protein [Methanosarcina sp.]